jgi:hypothetical protein
MSQVEFSSRVRAVASCTVKADSSGAQRYHAVSVLRRICLSCTPDRRTRYLSEAGGASKRFRGLEYSLAIRTRPKPARSSSRSQRPTAPAANEGLLHSQFAQRTIGCW